MYNGREQGYRPTTRHDPFSTPVLLLPSGGWVFSIASSTLLRLLLGSCVACSPSASSAAQSCAAIRYIGGFATFYNGVTDIDR